MLTRPDDQTILADQMLEVRGSEDVVRIRQAVRSAAVLLGFSLIDQTKLVTGASELARNTLDYGHGGTCRLESIRAGDRVGLRMTFEDHGPGIPDIELALRDGYTTGAGLGMGLGGTRRLVNEFAIHSQPGQGTTVVATRWTWLK